LRLLALSGRLAGLQSISLNLAQRITLELMIRDQEVVLVNVGSYDGVYLWLSLLKDRQQSV
jgi:proteic killer suppression protein